MCVSPLSGCIIQSTKGIHLCLVLFEQLEHGHIYLFNSQGEHGTSKLDREWVSCIIGLVIWTKPLLHKHFHHYETVRILLALSVDRHSKNCRFVSLNTLRSITPKS